MTLAARTVEEKDGIRTVAFYDVESDVAVAAAHYDLAKQNEEQIAASNEARIRAQTQQWEDLLALSPEDLAAFDAYLASPMD